MTTTLQEVKSLQEIVAERIMANKTQRMRVGYQAALAAVNRELWEMRRYILHLERENECYQNWGFDCGRCGAVHGR